MLAKSSLRSGKTSTIRWSVYHGRTDYFVQLLSVVQDKRVDLSIGRFLRNILTLGKMSSHDMRRR